MSVEGYLPHRAIKAIVFWVLTLCLLLAVTAGVLWIWALVDAESARRMLWTVFLVAGGGVAFLILNLLFGDLEMAFGNAASNHPIDPAFADRLHRAKDFREEQKQSKAG